MIKFEKQEDLLLRKGANLANERAKSVSGANFFYQHNGDTAVDAAPAEIAKIDAQE